ncbi:SOS response-associated peptidase family protein [Marinobacter halodurans]|nr:SOS response-associated peptidase family protein [Marinobacter halodurans]
MLDDIGLGYLASDFAGGSGVEHYYPAFGGNADRTIRHLIIPGEDGPRAVDATWWFDCSAKGEGLEVGGRTTFNARNLESPYWTGALKHHRAIVVATGLGESKYVDGKKHQFLMEGKRPFLLGALYRPFENGCYSCAVITRDSHPRFDKYHDKAFPCFLPATSDFVASWLGDDGSLPVEVARYLEHPRITVPLDVSEVKTFKSGVVGEGADHLEADAG